MDGSTIALLIGSGATAIGAIVAAVKAASAAYDTAVKNRAQQLHYEELAKQAEKTIGAKDDEIKTKNKVIAEKDEIISRERATTDEYRRENQRLWSLYNGKPTP